MPPPLSLMPHAVCWAASPRLIWTMVVTNLITFLSYLSICGTLLALGLRTRRVMARDWAFFVVGFALFIVACGSTHLLEVITTWKPIFWVDAWTNIVTAVLSGYVAFQLIRRAGVIGCSINTYSASLADSENERLRLQQSLLSAQKLEDWSRMSATVAHEIAQPLEAIHNLLYMMQTADGAPPDIVKFAGMADAEARRVLTIARSTLSFFRQSDEPEAIDLLQETESVRLVLESQLKKRQLAFNIESHGDTTVQAYAGEARQVLLNLVRNAMDASDKSGTVISVCLTGTAEALRIAVADRGTGIPAALLPTLFEFGKTTKGEQGNGVGLWTVRQIVERHHATISVESTPGEGTTFLIDWPRAFPRPAALSAPDTGQLAARPA